MEPALTSAMHERVAQDLQDLYDHVVVGLGSSQAARERQISGTWSAEHIFNTVIALRIRVDGHASPPASPGSSRASPDHSHLVETTSSAGHYRRPLGAARLVRPLYWLALAWAAIWSTASFATVTEDGTDVGSLVGGIALAVVMAVVLGAVPAIAVRSLVMYLDERAWARRTQQAQVDKQPPEQVRPRGGTSSRSPSPSFATQPRTRRHP
jgi:hypothetical protein